jgi:hypothetical protein
MKMDHEHSPLLGYQSSVHKSPIKSFWLKFKKSICGLLLIACLAAAIWTGVQHFNSAREEDSTYPSFSFERAMPSSNQTNLLFKCEHICCDIEMSGTTDDFVSYGYSIQDCPPNVCTASEGNVLRIIGPRHGKSWPGRRAKIIARIPRNYQFSVTVEDACGTVDALGVSILAPFDIATGLGDIKLINTKADLLAVQAGSGSLTLKNLHTSKLNAVTGFGDIELIIAKAELLAVQIGSGSIELKSIEAHNVRVGTGAGRIHGDLAKFVQLSGTSGAGSIELEMCPAQNSIARLETGVGNIMATLVH